MIHKIRLNHGQAAGQKSRWSLLLLCAGLVSAMLVVLSLQHMEAQLNALKNEQERWQHPYVNHVVSVQPSQSAGEREELAAVQVALADLTLPWDSLLSMLEGLNVPQVRLLTLEPNPRLHKLRLTAESESVDDMFDYLTALTRQPLLSQVFLVTHERSNDGRELPVNFVIEATWQQ